MSCLCLSGERRHSESAGTRSPALRLPRLLLRHLCKVLSFALNDQLYIVYFMWGFFSLFFSFLFVSLLLLCHLHLPPLPQLLAVFRFAVLILAYAVCKLRHWWAIAVGFKAVCHNSASVIAPAEGAAQQELTLLGAQWSGCTNSCFCALNMSSGGISVCYRLILWFSISLHYIHYI